MKETLVRTTPSQWLPYGNELIVRDTGIIVPPQTHPRSALSCFNGQATFCRGDSFFEHIKERALPNPGGRLIHCRVKDGGDYTALLYEFFDMLGRGVPCDVALAHSITDYDLALNLPQIEEAVQRHFAGSHDLELNEHGAENYFLTHNGEEDIKRSPISIVSVGKVLHDPSPVYAVEAEPLQGIISTVCDKGSGVYFLEGLLAAR